MGGKCKFEVGDWVVAMSDKLNHSGHRQDYSDNVIHPAIKTWGKVIGRELKSYERKFRYTIRTRMNIELVYHSEDLEPISILDEILGPGTVESISVSFGFGDDYVAMSKMS